MAPWRPLRGSFGMAGCQSACRHLEAARSAGNGRPAGSQEGQPAGPVDVQHAIPWDTSTATGRSVLAVIGAVGQAEREATFAQRVRHDRHVSILERKWLADGQPVCCSIGRRSHVVGTGIEAQPWLGKRPSFLEPNVTRAMPITNLARIRRLGLQRRGK